MVQSLQWTRNRVLLMVAVVVGVIGCAAFGAPAVWRSFQVEETGFQFATVERKSFEVTLVERGTIGSQRDLKVQSDVEDIRGDGIQGNAIIWMVDNGVMVKAGDLIVDLDSGTHIERVDEQVLETDQARADQIEADVLYKNQLSQNETLRATAELNVKLAELQLAMFKHPTNGTHRLEVDELKRMIDDTENEIMAAKAKLKLSENEREGLETLFSFGYAGKSELDKVRLDYLQAQSEVAAKTNRLVTQLSNVEKKNEFEWQMSLLTYEGGLKTAKRTLEQVELDNAATMAQAKTELDRANKVLATQERLMDRYQMHLAACKIYAPQDGMVAYALPRHGRESRIELGTCVYEGQPILSLPDLSLMQVKTIVHETARNKVKAGLKATIRLEAFPDQLYAGTVENVDLMPDRRSWEESDTKVYNTLVTIDDRVEGLKPGMTAIVEIHVARPENVIAVPVSAIVHQQETKYCYVRRGNTVERLNVKLGGSNQDLVEVTAGLAEGEEVVTNPLVVEQ